MTAMPYLPGVTRPSLELALENAVSLSWNELMPASPHGMINIEYHSGPEHLLEYLKVWKSSERGYWSLICEYWKTSHWSHVPGISFGKGFGPGDFSRRLEDVMNRENDFDKAPQDDSLIQINTDTVSKRLAAVNRKETSVV